MRVTFDCQIFCAQEFGGISRYFASLADEMSQTGSVRPQVVAPLHINRYLDRLPRDLVQGRRIETGRIAKPAARAASVFASTLLQAVRKPDLVHSTYYYPLPRPTRAAPNVLTVYDMIHERFPRAFSPADPIPRWKKAAVARADHVICISEHTRRDLLELYDVAPEKVSVTHLGYDAMVPLIEDEPAAVARKRWCGEDRPYLLYVGSRAGYKNFARLLDAYASSPWLRANFMLLCFGGGPFADAERSVIASHGLQNLVRQTGGSDAALAGCYRHAALFVYPSLYEGFGIPPLEAMSLDCPVACSNTSSLPEVVGDAAQCFDPHDTDAIRAGLEAALQTPLARAALIERGRLRRERFSWQRCAAETVDIYKSIIGT